MSASRRGLLHRHVLKTRSEALIIRTEEKKHFIDSNSRNKQRCGTKVLKYNYYNVDQSASQRTLKTDTKRHIKVIKVESQWFWLV